MVNQLGLHWKLDYPVYHLRLLLTQTYFHYSPWRVKQIQTLNSVFLHVSLFS